MMIQLVNVFLGVVLSKPRGEVTNETKVMGWQGNRPVEENVLWETKS
jgi:hypothetical protein